MRKGRCLPTSEAELYGIDLNRHFGRLLFPDVIKGFVVNDGGKRKVELLVR